MARTLVRSIRLLRAFRVEQSDPDRFYGLLASDAVEHIERHLPLAGARILDVGGGAGYFTAAFRRAGAACFVVEPDRTELSWRGAELSGSVIGDGYMAPFRSECVDLVLSSNVLEHVARPFEMIDELGRLARPGGLVWISFTNWYGPWGGHETSPWHYLGADYAERRYERRYGRSPKHHVGTNLFRIHVGPTLRYLATHPDLEIVEARPRYHPDFARGVIRLPGVREVVTWNLEVMLRRRQPGVRADASRMEARPGVRQRRRSSGFRGAGTS